MRRGNKHAPICVFTRQSLMCGSHPTSGQREGGALPTSRSGPGRGSPSLVAEAGRRGGGASRICSHSPRWGMTHLPTFTPPWPEQVAAGAGNPAPCLGEEPRVSAPQGLAPAAGPRGVPARPHIHTGAGPVPGGPPALRDEAEVTRRGLLPGSKGHSVAFGGPAPFSRCCGRSPQPGRARPVTLLTAGVCCPWRTPGFSV